MPPPPFFFMLQAPPSSALSRSILIPARGTELPISDGNTPSFISHHGRGNFLFPFCASLCIVTYTQHRCILRIALSLPIPPYNPPLPLSPAAKRSRAFALPLSLYLAVSFPFLVIPAGLFLIAEPAALALADLCFRVIVHVRGTTDGAYAIGP